MKALALAVVWCLAFAVGMVVYTAPPVNAEVVTCENRDFDLTDWFNNENAVVRFRTHVDYFHCTGNSTHYDTVPTVVARVDFYEGNKFCNSDRFDKFRMDVGSLGGWNPGEVSWVCQNGNVTYKYTWSPDLRIGASGDRGVSFHWTIVIPWSNDKEGSASGSLK